MSEGKKTEYLGPAGVPEPPPWLHASPEDLVGLDFEAPITGSIAADSKELAELYRSASSTITGVGDNNDDPAKRIWDMLHGLTSMHFKPEDYNEPFGPMLILANGTRTAIPADFRGHIGMIDTMAGVATNVVLKARLSDLAWLLDRKRSSLGAQAITAYVELIRLVESGVLKFGYASKDARFHHGTRLYLVRALKIGRTIGWKKAEAEAAKQSLVAFRNRAVAERDPIAVHWFCNVDLEFRVSESVSVARDLEQVLSNLPAEAEHRVIIDLWRLAALAYQISKRSDDVYRCQEKIADSMIAQADAASSAMLAAHFLGNAISSLHGIPTAKDRRLSLRHRLVDIQAEIIDEMTTFSQDIDLADITKKVQDKIIPLTLIDSLFVFAILASSPDPKKLEADALEAIRKYPLSSLFGAAHLDDEGKVIHRTSGSSDLSGADVSVVHRQIAQSEQLRRHIAVSGHIEPARNIITTHHYVAEDIFVSILRCSPFVPRDVLQTFARGFTHFFQGDFTSAVYILTPLLENSIRHVLKGRGHDVTIFNNATQTQQDRTISSIFEQMRPEIDAIFTRSITEDIDHVFLSKPGPYLRHGVAHGLLHDGDPYGTDAIYGCWLIFRLCVFPLIPHREELGLK